MEQKEILKRVERVLLKPTCALLGITLLTGMATAAEQNLTEETPAHPTLGRSALVLDTPQDIILEKPAAEPANIVENAPATAPSTTVTIPAPAEEVRKENIQISEEAIPVTLPPETTLPPVEEVAVAPSTCPDDWGELSTNVCYSEQANYHVVRVDLADPNVSVCPAYIDSPGRLGSLSKAAWQMGAVAATNASFFFKNGRNLGPLACEGQWISKDNFPEIVFSYRNDGTVTTQPTNEALASDVGSVRFAVSGSHVLVNNGEVQQDFGKDNKDGVLYKRHHRTAIGVDNENYLFMAVTENGNEVTMPELARFLGSLGTRMAINLDGGGSSQMDIYGKNVADRGSDERELSTGLFVVPNQ